MPITISAVGAQIPDDSVIHLDYEDEQSLSESDVIIFDPDFGPAWKTEFGTSTFQGLPNLTEDASFQLRDRLKFWHSELTDAINNGRTVIILLSKPRTVYVKTGEKRRSGTGRNQKVTTLVDSVSSWDALPFKFESTRVHRGSKLKTTRELAELTSFWSSFSDLFRYEASIRWKDLAAGIVTPGNRAAGGIARFKHGNVVLLPATHYPDSFMKEHDEGNFFALEEGTYFSWTNEAQQHGKRFVASVARLHRELRRGAQQTPAPTWADRQTYQGTDEKSLLAQFTRLESEVAILRQQQADLQTKIDNLGRLRGLLFEQGKPLEAAILDALRILGFKAEPYDDGESEFDALFKSAEGEFLGEAEGKDSKLINVEKLGQLERNIQEDFARDDVTEHKRGVLFGNASRLLPPADRKGFFTKKCIHGAKRAGVALVQTPDLFRVANYLRDKRNSTFAKKCRRAILESAGEIVLFPELPSSATPKKAGKRSRAR